MAEEHTQDWSPIITGGLVLSLGILATIAFLGRPQPPVVIMPQPMQPVTTPQTTPTAAPPDPSKTALPSAKPEPVDPTHLKAWFLPEDDGMWGTVDIRLDRPDGMSFWRGEIEAPTPIADGRGLTGEEDAQGSLDWLVGLLDFAADEGYRKVTVYTPINISKTMRTWVNARLAATAANIARFNETANPPYPTLFWVGSK